jgi:hypothetical protein
MIGRGLIDALLLCRGGKVLLCVKMSAYGQGRNRKDTSGKTLQAGTHILNVISVREPIASVRANYGYGSRRAGRWNL